MHDPTIAILATAILCGPGGFIAGYLLTVRRIQRAETEGWKSAVRFYSAREKQAIREARL